MGWEIPWYSTAEDFSADFGVDDEVFLTNSTRGRGVDALGSDWTFLDLTPFGRQEDWEVAPEGTPQGPGCAWWRLHDEYGDTAA